VAGLTLFFSAQPAEAASMNFTTPTVIWTDETIGIGEIWNVEPGITLTIAPTVNITNSGTITNNGLFEILDFATITNNGTINNLVTLDNFGTITNFGTINNFGDIINHETIINKCGGTFNNEGRYFGNTQVINEPCYGLDLFEGINPSNGIVDLNQELRAVASTDDSSVDQITFRWISPGAAIASEVTVPISTPEDTFAPDEPGDWVVEADFGNDQVIQKMLTVPFFVLPESPIGAIAMTLASIGALSGFFYIRSRRTPI
jgi:hypothetical protein